MAFAGERVTRAIRRSRHPPVVSYENVSLTFFSTRANAATEFTVPLWGGFASEVTLGVYWRTIVPRFVGILGLLLSAKTVDNSKHRVRGGWLDGFY